MPQIQGGVNNYPWSALRKSRSFLGPWSQGNPGSVAQRRRTEPEVRGQKSETPALEQGKRERGRASPDPKTFFYGPTVALGDIISFDSFFPDPIDCSVCSGLKADIYYGYLLPDGRIKYNVYELKIRQ